MQLVTGWVADGTAGDALHDDGSVKPNPKRVRSSRYVPVSRTPVSSLEGSSRLASVPDCGDACEPAQLGKVMTCAASRARSGGGVCTTREAEIHARIAQIIKDLNAKILRDGKPKALLRSPGSRQRAKDEITALGAELERITALGQVRSSPFRPRWADVADTDEVGDTTARATATTHGWGRGATARRRARGQGR